MDLLNKLTIKNLQLNKKRTIVTIIGIILSIALISAVISMFYSFQGSLIVYETQLKGDFHVMYENVSKNDDVIFKNNDKIQEYYYSANIGYAKVESVNEYKPYVFINAIRKSDYSKFKFNLLEGRMPNNSSEIVISEHLITNGKLKLNVGDSITLDVGTRVTHFEEEDYIANKYDSFHKELSETIEDVFTKTYKIVGIIERPNTNFEPTSSAGYSIITCLDNDISYNTLEYYVKLKKKNLKNIYAISAGILGIDKEKYTNYMEGNIYDDDILKELDSAKYETKYNSYLITLETGNSNDSTLNSLKNAVMIVIVIIIVTSVFCIKNSFDISITEKIKQYGMLSSIGATKKQIKKNVYFEAMVLACIGIPLGILSGLFASYILIIISNYLLTTSLNVGLIFVFSPLVIVFSVILGLITIILAARKSANKASKVTPISAIRNSEEIKIKSKGLKIPKWVNKLFGIGGEISYKNLKRSKKKYRTTVISIIVCSSVFVALSYFSSLGYKIIGLELNGYNYDFEIYYDAKNKNNGNIMDSIKLLTKEDIVKDYNIIKGNKSFINPEKNKYTKEYLKYNSNVTDEDFDDFNNLIVLEEESFKKYVKSLKLDYNIVKDKAIVTNDIWLDDGDKKDEHKITNLNKYNYKKGDIITLNLYNEQELDLEIAQVTNTLPFGLDDIHYVTYIIVNEDYSKYLTDSYYEFVYFKTIDANKLQKNMENILKGYSYNYNNVSENARQIKSIILLVSIFLYGFITVIALIGITNIFNTVNTNMMLRKREFAMLKSIGMTKKEFNRMIRLESIFYGFKSLIIGIPIGIVISYIIYHVIMNGEYSISYQLPILAIIITCLTVFILIYTIMKYSINKINKQNIIETIRNENI